MKGVERNGRGKGGELEERGGEMRREDLERRVEG